MIVVDTNVLGYLCLTSERSAQAEAALRRDLDWVAPWLWRSELANVLVTYVRHGRLTAPDAVAIMDGAMDRMLGGEFEVSPARVLSLDAESGCSAYDCEFAALALDLGVKLVTVDRRLLRAFPEVAVPLESFA